MRRLHVPLLVAAVLATLLSVSSPAQAQITEPMPTPLTGAACGSKGPADQDPSRSMGADISALIRTGTGPTCPAIDVIVPNTPVDYHCYTFAPSNGHTWTYLENMQNGVRGWVLDDHLALNLDGVTRGSLVQCREFV